MLYPSLYEKSENQDEDAQAFMEEILSRYERLILYVLRQCVDDTNALSDLAQTVLENLCRMAKKLKTYDDEHLTGYVVTTAKHVAYNYNKRKGIEKNVLASQYLENRNTQITERESVVETKVIRNETITLCREELDKLSEHEQWLLYSKYILQMSNEQIAKLENCKPDSVRMKLTRVRRKARELLEKRGVEQRL